MRNRIVIAMLAIAMLVTLMATGAYALSDSASALLPKPAEEYTSRDHVYADLGKTIRERGGYADICDELNEIKQRFDIRLPLEPPTPEETAEMMAKIAEYYAKEAEEDPDWYIKHAYDIKGNPNHPEIPAKNPDGTNNYTQLDLYADVPSDAWYAQAVNAVSVGGLLKGYDDGLFHPNDVVTQGQFAVILCRLMGLSTDPPRRASRQVFRRASLPLGSGGCLDDSCYRSWSRPRISYSTELRNGR